ncbi:VPLPA-CTERM sorting domain-containing protein [uncultured Rhodospira sp.]|uniref:VPLPA-CTERM sorting domain-containing protein n=1 Tax=uncultured Rhodospira sp. TaxID=1936189 RepID=UPI00261A8DEB|nr:VPLPA-CTERM sorting domain-containing protein [uncultured Rhodospira sp.]
MATAPNANAALTGTVTDNGQCAPGAFSPKTSGDTVGFFIPIDGSNGTYGCDGFGTSATTIRESNLVPNGTLDMYFDFTGFAGGAGVIELTFTDLDLDGVEDPSNFLEQVVVTPDGGNATTFTKSTDDGVAFNTGGDGTITLDPLGLSPNFVLQLSFEVTNFHNWSGNPWVKNVEEQVMASVSAVPLPAAAWFMLTALGGLVGTRWLRREQFGTA